MLSLAEAIINLKPPSSYSVTVTVGSTLEAKDFGFAATTSIQALSGDDIVFGTAFGEELRGGSGADQINGGPGDDKIYGEEGNDILNGGEGLDQAIYKGNKADYTLGFNSSGFTITDNKGTEGLDILSSIEQAVFADTILNIDTNAPTVTNFSPSDDAIGVSINANLVLTFNESIQFGTGNIELKTLAGVTIANFPVTSSTNLSIVGSILTIDPTSDFTRNTEYKLEFAAGTIKDIAGNNFAGTNFYNFTTEVNGTPVANSVSIKTNEDTSSTGTLSGTDADGNKLTFTKVSDPSNGTVTINATTGAYTYTPNANYSGADSFSFKVNDGTADSAVATVSLTIAAVNDLPTGKVIISGASKQGQTLNATNTLADADGLGAFSYKWKADGVDISGATSSSFTLTKDQVGKKVSVAISYTDLLGSDEIVVSELSSLVASAPTLSGQIYHWKTHTLMKDVSVGIDSLSISSKSNAAGAYALNSIEAEAIKLKTSLALTTFETGNVISTADALAALKIAVGRNPNPDDSAITPYQLIAADVNQDGKVTTADALAILKMAVNRSDALAREWFFVSESQDFWDESANNGQGDYTVSRTNVTWNKDLQASVTKDTTVNLLAVLKGDVNVSWTGPTTDIQKVPDAYFLELVKKGFGPLPTWGVVVA
jgi:hypothetical protein